MTVQELINLLTKVPDKSVVVLVDGRDIHGAQLHVEFASRSAWIGDQEGDAELIRNITKSAEPYITLTLELLS
jgi:hypothetical protein